MKNPSDISLPSSVVTSLFQADEDIFSLRKLLSQSPKISCFKYSQFNRLLYTFGKCLSPTSCSILSSFTNLSGRLLLFMWAAWLMQVSNMAKGLPVGSPKSITYYVLWICFLCQMFKDFLFTKFLSAYSVLHLLA